MTMIVDTHCKRFLAPYADLLEPMQKRVRMDGCQDSFASSSALSCGLEAAAAEPLECRRHEGLHDFQDFAPEQPAEKRIRLEGAFGPAAGGADLGAHGVGDGEVALRGWAEALVRSLQNCPSTEEATQRSVRILRDLVGEVQQGSLREGDVTEAASEGALQSLQQTKKVLMRAVNHLAQRCRELQASAGEADELREALERSQEEKRRMNHANEMLKGHLRLYMDGHQ